MDVHGLKVRSLEMVGQARQVYATFPDGEKAKAIRVTNPNTSMVHPMYLPDLIDLIAFRETIQEAQKLDPEARGRLSRQITVIEQEFGLS
jgi:hypothetical protein